MKLIILTHSDRRLLKRMKTHLTKTDPSVLSVRISYRNVLKLDEMLYLLIGLYDSLILIKESLPIFSKYQLYNMRKIELQFLIERIENAALKSQIEDM